jgi:hypothetical protein
MLAMTRFQKITSQSKQNAGTYDVGQRVCGSRRLSGSPIAVNADAAEVMAKARFKKSARPVIQWLAGQTQNFLHDGRSGGGVTPTG